MYVTVVIDMDCLKRAASIGFPLPIKRHRKSAVSLDALIA